jgi:hypothetical protein
MLETELNNISEIINNMTILCKTNDEQDDEQVDEQDDEQDDEQVDESVNESVVEQVDESDTESIKEPVKKTKKSSKNNETIIKPKKIQTIEYKNKTYILEDDKVFKMDVDGNKEKFYGNLVDGKVKKLKSNDKEICI